TAPPVDGGALGRLVVPHGKDPDIVTRLPVAEGRLARLDAADRAVELLDEERAARRGSLRVVSDDHLDRVVAQLLEEAAPGVEGRPPGRGSEKRLHLHVGDRPDRVLEPRSKGA